MCKRSLDPYEAIDAEYCSCLRSRVAKETAINRRAMPWDMFGLPRNAAFLAITSLLFDSVRSKIPPISSGDYLSFFLVLVANM